AYAAIEQKTNPVLTFRSPGQTPQSPAAQVGAPAAQPSKPPPRSGQQVGTTNDTADPNPNCQPGGNQLACLQGYSGSRYPGQAPGLAGSPSAADQVHTTPITPNKTAEAKPAPQPSGGSPTNGVQTIRLTRAVPIDRDVRLDFIYAINPDCS